MRWSFCRRPSVEHDSWRIQPHRNRSKASRVLRTSTLPPSALNLPEQSCSVFHIQLLQWHTDRSWPAHSIACYRNRTVLEGTFAYSWTVQLKPQTWPLLSISPLSCSQLSVKLCKKLLTLCFDSLLPLGHGLGHLQP